MKGMRLDDLLVIVDFLYHGEANIYQENLDSFLSIAEELKLKGLTGTDDSKENLVDIKENNVASIPICRLRPLDAVLSSGLCGKGGALPPVTGLTVQIIICC